MFYFDLWLSIVSSTFVAIAWTSGREKYSKWRGKGSEIGKLTRSGASRGAISWWFCFQLLNWRHYFSANNGTESGSSRSLTINASSQRFSSIFAPFPSNSSRISFLSIEFFREKGSSFIGSYFIKLYFAFEKLEKNTCLILRDAVSNVETICEQNTHFELRPETGGPLPGIVIVRRTGAAAGMALCV